MKSIKSFTHFMFSDRFSFFDNLMMLIFVSISLQTQSLWWLLAIIPASLVGAVLTIKFGKNSD
jgi:hypothetical protein